MSANFSWGQWLQSRIGQPSAVTSRPRRSLRKSRRCNATPAIIQQVEPRQLLTTIDLATAGEAATQTFGPHSSAWSGYSVSSAGDINGDGFDDQIIGSPSRGTANDFYGRFGKTYVIFGGASQSATLNLNALGAAGIFISGAQRGATLGTSVSAAGDVNGDGFDDLLVGGPTTSILYNDYSDHSGRSYVIFGGASLPSTINVGNLGTGGITILGADAGDTSGSSVSTAGDVNGDGFDDLIIGAPSADAAGNSKANAGESYVVFGGAALPQTIDLENLGSTGVTIFGADADDRSGISVSNAGDVNKDGFADVLIGADRADAAGNGKSSAGESYLIFGGGSLPASINLASLGTAGVKIFGADINDYSGHSVSDAGDVNGDGFDDVIIGAWYADGLGNNKSKAGEAYVVYGSASLAATINLASLGSAGITLLAVDAGDLAGRSVSGAGDVNGDGYDDLIIGAPDADAAGNSKTSAGESYLVFGGTALSSTIDLANLGTGGVTIYGSNVGTNQTDITVDRSGSAVSGAGDVNGDGFDDLIIGAFTSNSPGSLVQAGKNYIILGRDFSGSVTHPGTPVAETLTGTAGANVMIGGRGNDVFVGAGGADVQRGGQGNDVLGVSDLTFKRIVGGNGLDRLQLNGAGLTLNLTTMDDNRLQGIEQIDITGTGNNTLTLNLREVLNLSDESNTLLVRRNAGDTLNRGAGWVQGADEVVDGVTLQVFTQGAATLKVQVVALLIESFDTPVTYVENDPAVPIDADAVVVTDGFANFNTGTLTVSLTVNGQAADRLEIQNQGVGAGQIGVTGASVTFGGVTIGTFAGGVGVTNLVVTLNANATQPAVQALLRSITFRTLGENPVTLPRTVQVALTNGLGANSNLPTKPINVTPVNDGPVLSGIEVTPLAYAENGAPLVVTSSVVVGDVDNTTLAGARIRISTNYQNGGDILSFVNAGAPAITGSWSAATGTLVLTGVATVAQYQSVLRTVRYRNLGDNPGNLTRTVLMLVNDGTINSNVVSRQITVTSANDAPTLAAIETATLTYIENAAPISLTSTLTVTDPDNINLVSARIKIATNYVNGQDVLSFTNTPKITGVWSGATATLVLTGTDTAANYQTALRSVKYHNLSDTPSTLTRQVLMLVNDGAVNSNLISRNLMVTPQPESPVLSSIETTPATYAALAPRISVTSTIVVSDADNATLQSAQVQITTNYQLGSDILSFVNTATITAVWNAATGTLTLTGSDTKANYQAALRNVKFRNISDNPPTVPRTVRFTVSDGVRTSNIASRNINVTP